MAKKRAAVVGRGLPTVAESEGGPAPESTPGDSASRPSGEAPVRLGPDLEVGPGTRLQQYELIRQLGSGGMGTVFLARDTRLGRRVAIKFLHTQAPEHTRRFLLEARTTAQCNHENIIVIHEVGELRGAPFMVLEFLQGRPLKEVIRRQRLPPARAVELMAPVVRALACAHAQNIVHRDLKPENVLVTDSGGIKVLDFGIAKVLHGEEEDASEGRSVQGHPAAEAIGADPSNVTRKDAILGTLAYMAPEQWGIGIPVDHRTDIWAAGIMLFRMLAGKHPLAPLKGQQLVVTAMLNEPMPRLREVAPDVPAELAEAVDRCLRKRKEERFPDAQSLLRALEPFLPGHHAGELRLDESPYAGLRSFQETDAGRFFGRSREIAALVSRLHDRPLVAVVGPSGAGKSSFVRAGVVPALKGSGEAWEAHVIRPGRHPLAALASLVAPLVRSSPTLEADLREQQELVERLRAEPGHAGAVLRSHARRERRRLLLFVDQFEELYTQVPDARERMAFTACLAGIADDAAAPVRVAISLRSDFLDRVAEDERFMAELSQGLFFLTPPGRAGLREALLQPAEMAGYRFETPQTVEHMLGHLETTPGALPLLQFAATRLWEARDPVQKLLTKRAYQEMGGIGGALASHADSVVAGLTVHERALVRAILLRLVTPERTRAIVSVEELAELSKDTGELQRLVDQLVQARLLVVQTGSGTGGATVELVHESLVNGWPTLRRWLEESQEDSAFLEQLRHAARQWQANGRDSDLLWRGELVEEARRFRRRSRGELPETQRDFLDAVLAQAERAARRRRALVAGSTVCLLLLVAASAVALVVIQRARREAEHQTMVARRAEKEARQHLEEVQAKERERRQAQRDAEAAKIQAEAAKAQAERANDELQRRNAELREALSRAQREEENARLATQRAELAAAEAQRARDEAQRLLEQEKERARILGPMVEVLKGEEAR